MLVHAEPSRHGGGEEREPARHQRADGAGCPHRLHQRAGAGGERDALGQHRVDDAGREAFQKRDALTQGGFEGDLAAHRPLGDGGDVVLESGEIGEFVDAFLADERGIHVGQQQRLAPVRLGLHENVERMGVGPGGGGGAHGAEARLRRGKGEVGRFVRRQPMGGVGPRD